MNNSSLITNPKRRKQIEEFLDKEHMVMDRYYDLLDRELSTMRMRNEMEKLIREDPDFYDPYLIAADILKSGRRLKESRELRYIAYEKALKRIVDKEGNFPKALKWGWLDNRHIIRAIESWAFELWKQGKTEDALRLFRKLLESNPNDNIGARQNILAIRLGLGSDYEERFAAKDTPGYLDAFKLNEWFDKHSKKFSDEFDWWFKAMKEE